MPYDKGRRGKKKFKLGRKLAKRGSIYGSAAQQLWKDVKWLKSVINVEKKVLDTALLNQVILNTGQVVWMSTITTGTAYNQRTGMVVKASNISLRMNLTYNSAGTDNQQLRVVLIYNKSLTQGVTPAIGDILQNINTPLSPYNLDNVGDYVVLYDHKYDLDSQRPQKQCNVYRKLHHHIRWDVSGDAIADTETGHIFLFLLSDQAANGPSVDIYSRLRYVDN